MEIIKKGVYLCNNKDVLDYEGCVKLHKNSSKENLQPENASKNTIAYKILNKHNVSQKEGKLKIKFDALASHDITYVGIIQTARASGLKEFPLPYVLTNCHNSLCAVGGTINEDDHVFGLSAAKKFGGIFVPPHISVIHQFTREMMTRCGNMILGSDSHTRYGALGTMGIGEGGPELVKQLLKRTYDVDMPQVIAVYLEGEVQHGVGPQDVALSIIGAVFKSGFVKNKILEFVGPGISNLSMDFRNGIDVMTTETACLSSIWVTDDKVKKYYKIHGREDDYSELKPGNIAYYDGMIKIDLSKVESMIALPFHPSNVFTIKELNKHPEEILESVEEDAKKKFSNNKLNFNMIDKVIDGKIKADQGVIAGCAGGSFENICKASDILKGRSVGCGYFSLDVYPASQPIYMDLVRKGIVEKLIESGAVFKTAFCGPCFGAGDVPSNNGLSLRHTTRNFPNREGSKPGEGQIASVALMDSLSIAATAANGGFITPATDVDFKTDDYDYNFDPLIYKKRVYNGFKNAKKDETLKIGPNITPWPEIKPLSKNIILKVVSVINDPVTTTDELIPSGETSSYRSNPLRLAQFTLSRKDPLYVKRAKDVKKDEESRESYVKSLDKSSLGCELKELFESIFEDEKNYYKNIDEMILDTSIGSTIFAVKPGDGSAREQAASCQRVLGGFSNIVNEYATKRYRSNLINWGMIPFTVSKDKNPYFKVGDYIFIKGIQDAVKNNKEEIEAEIIEGKSKKKVMLEMKNISDDEREIILKGCLINYYKSEA